MTGGERRLAAIMFTDMVGYTTLSQKNEVLAMELLEEHRRLVRPLFPKHKGKEVKTIGDAFLVEFASALEAVRCAYDIQQSLNDMNSNRPAERRVQLRIGVHLGDVIHEQDDVYGDAVNVASRIEPLAIAGGICITAQVYDQIKNKFEFPLQILGRKELKNVGEPTEIYRIVLPWETEEERRPSLDSRRIVILPFVNMSPDPQDEFFADGLTEELIGKLCQVKELEVIARTSAMSYKKKDKRAGEIGRELRVGSLVEGSVRKAGNQIRVTAQLINAETEGHLWSSNYDRNFEDIFGIQSDIAERVAEALRVQLLPSEKKAIEKKRTVSTEAFTLYLKGRYFWNERTKEGLTKSITYFERAIENDPGYALAYAGLADSYVILANYGYVKPEESLPKARESAAKALEIDGTLAEAHASLGAVHYNLREIDEAGRELRKAIQLNPSYATAHQWYGDYLFFKERNVERMMAEKLKAKELDPLSPVTNLNIGACLYMARRYDEAEEEMRRTLDKFPDFWNAHLYLAFILTMKGRFEECTTEIDRAASLGGDELHMATSRAAVYALWGKSEAASKQLELMKSISKVRYVPPYLFGFVFAALGRKDDAFQWLEKGYEETEGDLIGILLNDPLVKDKLGTDPRWSDLLQRLGLPP